MPSVEMIQSNLPDFPNLPHRKLLYLKGWKAFNIEVILNRKSAIEDDKGFHLIVQAVQDGAGDDSAEPRIYTDAEKAALFIFAVQFCNTHSPKNDQGEPLWRIETQGPGMASRKHFHLHLKFVYDKASLPRIIAPVQEVSAN
jgi:hypothetical protein